MSEEIFAVTLTEEEAYRIISLEEKIEKCKLGIRAAQFESLLKKIKLEEELKKAVQELNDASKSQIDAFALERKNALNEASQLKEELAEKYNIDDISKMSFDDEFFCLVKDDFEDEIEEDN
jgi:predicted nucleotidyltransferase